MSRRQVLSVAVLVTVLGWSVVLVAVGQPAAAAAVVPSLALSAEQVVTAMTDGARGPAPSACAPVPEAPVPVPEAPAPAPAGPAPVPAGPAPATADRGLDQAGSMPGLVSACGPVGADCVPGRAVACGPVGAESVPGPAADRGTVWTDRGSLAADEERTA